MRLFISKFLFLIVTLNVMVAASVPDSINKFDEFARSIRQTLNKNDTDIIIIMLIVVIILVVSVVLFEIHRLNKFRQEFMSLAWGKFDSYARSLKLNSANIYLLKEIVQEVGLQDPNSIMKSPNVFEKTLEKYYASKKIEDIDEKKLTNIRTLRRALGFLPLSKEIAFISTRQFDHGEKCMVQIPESGPVISKGMSAVLFTKEKNWSIERLENSPKVTDGTWIRMNLTRPGDAEYTFRVQVLKDTGEELVLSHAEKLNRAQQRNWVRIDVSIPVEVIYKVTDDVVGDIFNGKIIDMSGGGLGMALPTKLTVGAKLKLSFELPGHGPINDLLVKVVRVAGQHNNSTETIHSVAFEGDVHLIQEQIIQYVFEKQRQDILTRLN